MCEKGQEEKYNANLTREIIKTGGTNADYPQTLAESIIAEVGRDNWDSNYMIEKAKSIISFLEHEQRRANSLEHQNLTEDTIRRYRERIYKDIPNYLKSATTDIITKKIMEVRPMLDKKDAKAYAEDIQNIRDKRVCDETIRIIYDIRIMEEDKLEEEGY